MVDLKRNQFVQIHKLLELFPVVMILGTRQCGKTTVSRQVRPDWTYIDLEKMSDFDRVTRDYDFFFRQHPQNVIFDEAQICPDLFKELRHVVDQNRGLKNRFLLTGSSSPELLRQASESLAGRVGLIELGTLKMNEIYEQPLPDFYRIFDKEISRETITEIERLKSSITFDQVMDVFLNGGYPEPVLSKDKNFHLHWMENYFETYIQRDVRRLFPRLDHVRYQRFISMLGSLTGTIINKSQLGRSLDTSEVTVRDYLDVAHGTFIWRKISSFEKSVSKSVIKMPKGYIRDSGLAHYLQDIRSIDKLHKSPLVGSSFEAFVCEELIKGMQATNVVGDKHHFYRTRNGVEIDLILSGSFGVLPIEIKYGMSVTARQLVSMKQFLENNKLPLGLIINNAERIERLAENILQVPARFV